MFGKGFILREENDMIIKSVNLETVSIERVHLEIWRQENECRFFCGIEKRRPRGRETERNKETETEVDISKELFYATNSCHTGYALLAS